MAKNCLVHKDIPAATHCHECHKPICKSCVMVTPQGSFCSSECCAIYREMKARLASGERTTRGKKVVLAIMMVMLAIIALHFVAREVPAVRPFDLLGKVLGYPDPKR